MSDESNVVAETEVDDAAEPTVEEPPAIDAEAGSEPSSGRIEQLEAEGDIAADYLEELLDIADIDGDLNLDVRQGRAYVSCLLYTSDAADE